MDDSTPVVGLMLFGAIIGALISAFLVLEIKQSEAIERGYALHCPDTGKFAWKGECE